MPQIPTDVLQMIFDELEAELPLERPEDCAEERRRLGCNISLVCRAWRRAGTAMCWRSVIIHFTGGRNERLVHHFVEHEDVAASVEHLCLAWERQENRQPPISDCELSLKDALPFLRGIKTFVILNPPREVMRSFVTDPDAEVDDPDRPAFYVFPDLHTLDISQDWGDSTPPHEPALGAAELLALLHAAPGLKTLIVSCAVDDDSYSADLDVDVRPIESASLRLLGTSKAIFDVTDVALRSLDPASTTSLSIASVPYSRSFFDLVAHLRNLRHLALFWDYEDALALSIPRLADALRRLRFLRNVFVIDEAPASELDDSHQLSHDILASIPPHVPSVCVSLAFWDIKTGPLAKFVHERSTTALRSIAVFNPEKPMMYRKVKGRRGWAWEDAEWFKSGEGDAANPS